MRSNFHIYEQCIGHLCPATVGRKCLDLVILVFHLRLNNSGGSLIIPWNRSRSLQIKVSYGATMKANVTGL